MTTLTISQYGRKLLTRILTNNANIINMIDLYISLIVFGVILIATIVCAIYIRISMKIKHKEEIWNKLLVEDSFFEKCRKNYKMRKTISFDDMPYFYVISDETFEKACLAKKKQLPKRELATSEL